MSKPITYCGVDGCSERCYGNGLCSKHYQRFKRNGSTERVRREKGSYTLDAKGYRLVTIDGAQIREHIAVVEKVLGKKLPAEVVVHHVNGDKADNRNENLVVCQDDSYHKILHMRARALAKCGDANKRKCKLCKQYDFVENMRLGTRCYYHQTCQREYDRNRRGVTATRYGTCNEH